jgi:hypothetical protein
MDTLLHVSSFTADTRKKKAVLPVEGRPVPVRLVRLHPSTDTPNPSIMIMKSRIAGRIVLTSVVLIIEAKNPLF